ncbi:tetratricopeptide repeat protein [Scytonema sp. PRP1]|uniref:tetratricopeptide repeat protein n=1 Tax=Scytonema sp. PRP1 TaxID=3120513 RepID=UPI00300C58D5
MGVVSRSFVVFGITALVIALWSHPSSAQTPDFPCFMVTASGEVISLDHVCGVSSTPAVQRGQLPNLTSTYTQIRQSLNNRDFESAIDGYTQLLRQQPDSARAYLTRGLIYWNLDNRQNATTDLQQAARLFQAQEDQAYFLATQELIRQIQSEE